MCDGLRDCENSDDEEHCTTFSNIVPHVEICKMIFSEDFVSLQQYCPRPYHVNSNKTLQMACGNVWTNLSKLTFDFSHKASKDVFKSQIENNSYCTYELNDCGFIKEHPNGAHLISCENHTCPDKHFKCPGFYCIPWRYVCNDRTDCPGGTDEIACNRMSCPGMFKCKGSVICLSLENLCDSVSDCGYPNEDEMFCSDRTQHCPQSCSCLLFSISCRKNKLDMNSKLNIFLSIHLVKVTFDQGYEIMDSLDKPIILTLNYCNLTYVCKKEKKQKQLRHIVAMDFSNNKINELGKTCFVKMKNIRLLNMSKNILDSISSFVFSSCTHLEKIDISHNNIIWLHDHAFLGVSNISFLNITNNPVVFVGTYAFSSANIKHIFSDQFKVCCIKPSRETTCTARPTWPNTCGRFIKEITVRILAFVICGLGILMNISSVIIILKKILPGAESYANAITCLCISDTLCCGSLMIILTADEIMRESYLSFEHTWRGNFFCYCSSLLYNTSNLFPIFTINVLAFTRYSVIRSPLTSKFLDKNFMTRICIGTCFLAISMSALLMVLHIVTTNSLQLPTGLCLLLGNVGKSVVPMVVAIIMMLMQAISCITVPLTYFLLFKEMAKSKPKSIKHQWGMMEI